MTTETTEAKAPDPSVGATTDTPLCWHQINWRQAERNVRRLQPRIAQATKAGKWGKVKALQRLLTHSLSGKAPWALGLTDFLQVSPFQKSFCFKNNAAYDTIRASATLIAGHLRKQGVP